MREPTGDDFIITHECPKPSFILTDPKTPATFSVMNKQTGEYLGRNIPSFVEAKKLVEDYCKEAAK